MCQELREGDFSYDSNFQLFILLGPVSIDCSLVVLWPDRMRVDVTAQLHNNTILPSIDWSRSGLVTTPQGNSRHAIKEQSMDTRPKSIFWTSKRPIICWNWAMQLGIKNEILLEILLFPLFFNACFNLLLGEQTATKCLLSTCRIT